MQETWLILQTFSFPSDAVDIILVAIPFYVVFRLLRESRSSFALWGIILTLIFSVLLYLLARLADLQATQLIYERFWIIVLLVFLIIFQTELRMGMTDIGRLGIFRAFFPQKDHVIGEIIEAVGEMAKSRTGALIAFERRNTLKPYTGTGTILDSMISAGAVRSVFNMQSPLHDGALIVASNRLLAASCILPLAESTTLSKDLGTRHRAAIGLSEKTDAVVIVISEETGTISLSTRGQLERHLTPDDLRKLLERELNLAPDEEEAD